MDMAFRLEGLARNVGRHAGGVVIAPTVLLISRPPIEINLRAG